jgi:hypothetical protein
MEVLAQAVIQVIMLMVVAAHHALQTVRRARMEVLAPVAHLDTIYQAALAHHVL